MRRFLVKCLTFLFFFLLLDVCIILVYVYTHKITRKEVPALNFSSSYSFNEKIRFLQTKQKNATVLAIGSSMSQNNIHSETLISNLHTARYLNTSSWGMSMGDNFRFLKSLSGIYSVKGVVMASSITDFQQTEKIVDYRFVESYLTSRTPLVFAKIIEHFDAKYYERNWSYARKVRNYMLDYDYLQYDDYGAVNFPKDGFHINKDRWIRDYLECPGLDNQYSYLDSISAFCKRNRIRLMFFQSPLRQGVFSVLESYKKDILSQHTSRIKNIVEKNGHLFVDSNELLWSDSLFADATHFNVIGSRMFTQYCFDRIKATQNNNFMIQ